MDGYLLALGLALLPAAGNFVGGLAAEFFAVSRKALSCALHLAAGLVLAVVGLELMPPAVEGPMPWLPVLAFVLGGGFFMLVDSGVNTTSARMGGGAARVHGSSTSAWRWTCSAMAS